MLPANNLFLDDSIEKRISIVSDDETINLTNADIHSEKFTLKESICSETSLKVGNCEANSVEFTIDNTPPSMTGKWLTITITPYNRSGTAGTAISLGRFKVFSDKPSGDRQTRTILAYDKLFYVGKRNYKRWYRKVAFSESATLTIKQFRDAFFEKIGITQVSATLSNDGMSIKRVKVASKLTGKDILTAICEINGVFGHITRDGEFKYIKLSTNTSATSIGKTYTINVEYSDNALTAVDRVEMLGKNGDLLASVGNDEDSYTNKYTIENNFIVNGLGGKAYYETALQAMRTVLTTLSFVPLTAEMKGHPRYEVGDRITYSVGNTTKTSFILNRTMTGIQALYDTYDSNVEEYYSNEPNAVNTKTAQIQSMEYQIGAVEDMTNTHLEKMDDGTIVIRDENLAGDEDSGAVCTRSFCMWGMNETIPNRPDAWITFRVEIELSCNFMIVTNTGHYGRIVNIAGETYYEQDTWLIYKVPKNAGSATIREKNTLIAYAYEDCTDSGTRFDGQWSVAWGQWGQPIPLGGDKRTIGDYDFYRLSHGYGTVSHGIYGMSRPDKHYPSRDALWAAYIAGEINPMPLKNGDVVLPSATAQQQTIDNLVGLANEITGQSGSGSDTSTENRDSIPTSGTPTDVASNSKQEIIANTINAIKDGISSWIGSIVNSGRGKVVATVTKRDGTTATQILASTNLITSGSEPPLTGAAQNDLHCVISDASGITMSVYSHDGDCGIEISRYGYDGVATSKHNSSGEPLVFNQFVIAISGLTSGTQYTISYKLSAATYDTSANEYSNITYNQATIEGVTKRYGKYGVMFSDTASPDMTNVPTFGSENTWDATLKWQNFPDLQRTSVSFSNTFTATASTMYMVFELEPITTHDYPLCEKFWVEELKESNMSISFNALKVYGEDNTWYEFAGGGQGTMDYDNLENQPQVNGVTLSGNKTSRDLQIFEKKHLSEFEQLSTAQKNNPDKFYFVDDKGGSGGGGGGGSSTLAGLTDVDLDSPTNGQVLKYNSTTQKWENANGGSGAGSIITYGYLAPTESGNDGDLYYLLDESNKKDSLYLNMEGSWALIEGSGYAEPSIYIPNSTRTKIICEATLDNFDDTALTWGDRSNPINLTATCSIYDNEAVRIPVKSNGTLASVDLGAAATPFTAYIVAKTQNPGSYARILSAFYSRSSGQGIMLFGSTINVSSWASDTSTGVSSSSNYFVGVIQYIGSGSALGKVNATNAITKSPSNCGRYLTIGRTDIDSSTSNAEPCDMLVKYLGVVKDVDSAEDIADNIANLMSIFEIS